MELFGNQVYNLNIPSADISLQRLYNEEDGYKIFDFLKSNLNWQQEHINIYGKDISLPRLTAWHGEKNYTYSGITSLLQEWTPELLKIKERVEQSANEKFNGVFLNWYRDGKDSISWHSDNEPELGEDPIIASLSFGTTRTFKLMDKNTRAVFDIDLYNGSLLLMGKGSQTNFLHSIPKTKSEGERINLTFRSVK